MDDIARSERRVFASAAGLASDEARAVWWHALNGAHWRCAPDYGCRKRRFFAHQVMYIVKGWGEGEYRGERFRAGPGHAVLMDLADVHGYRCEPNTPWEMFWVRFDGPGVHAAFESLLRAGGSCVLPVADGQRMRRDFRALFRLLGKQAPGREGWPAARLVALLANVQEGMLRSKRSSAAGGPKAPAGIEAALKMLRERHQETVALADAARAARMSPYHFLRRFKQATGFTPMAYLEQYRIGRAQEMMLAQPDLRLKEIAARVGFQDPAYFSRVFRKRAGLSPRAYRRNLDLR
ncbi:MAG: AraC family transcriptional regulator [Planctomycetes bacterium]|nr:AraC family transcriptional regulator [Planctomycetota bacterium]